MTITASLFREIIAALGEQAADDIAWSENLQPPTDAEDFASEAIFVICNSGMKNTIAVKIFAKVMTAIQGGISAFAVFGHPGKAKAIDTIWRTRDELLAAYLAAPDKIEFCASLPWIGGITKYHLAKNFGADVAKPDVHLQRLADREGVTAQFLCDRLASETGYRAATVDVVLWRACANGVLNSRTGEFLGTRTAEPATQGELGL
ncbi:hypothetical protein [Mesorhizobium sp.]|uniref:hypothetical protein n=1 Tax=Mesorhizobium sp. TaxID=1871066 RepID=UPI000FEA8EED|nr:hypothetical protein [Mesorhizobium sp.]RWP64894.1 MAG: hypothetical protein EOR08_08245 [Mesorhizobium sp.]